MASAGRLQSSAQGCGDRCPARAKTQKQHEGQLVYTGAAVDVLFVCFLSLFHFWIKSFIKHALNVRVAFFNLFNVCEGCVFGDPTEAPHLKH